MKSRLSLLILLSGLLGTIPLIAALTFVEKVEPTPENVSKGQAIYKKHCQMCHGETGLGDGPAGKRLNPKPYNFQDKEKMAAQTDEHLFKDISKGEGPMPAFERKLKEDERWMVLHYIRTFSK